jgi:ATP-dependent protease ClpP protease subunit
MRVYETIGEDFWTGKGITAAGFAEELDNLGDIKRLNLHINCLGGDTHTAQAIYNILADHSSRKTAYIDGIAASAATIVACGAHEVVARRNTNYMIHNPWTLAMGNAADLREAAEVLDKITIPIVQVYKQQVNGKIDEDKIRSLMDAETWMTAEEALEYGFVDKVRGKVKALASADKSHIISNGKVFNLGKYQYKHVPSYPKAAVRLEVKEKPKEEELKKGPTSMTLEEMRTQSPELLASIQSEARAAERQRLSALDAMMAPGCEAIIAKAKADSSINPADIALECNGIIREQLSQQANLNALQKDAGAASNVPAGDAPTSKVAAVRTRKDRGVKLLAAAQANLNQQRRPHLQQNGNRS